jgi:hypothetical protein
MTYACPVWELAADNHLLKLQHQQNRVLCTTENFPRRTPVRDLHMAFKLPYTYFIAREVGPSPLYCGHF